MMKLMKKNYLLLFVLSLLGMSAKGDDSMPQWAYDLIDRNPELIDSIVSYNSNPDAPNTTSYIVYYNQPLQHANPASEHFHMRVLLTVDNEVDPTTAVNHVYCSGYNITPEFLYSPNLSFQDNLHSYVAEISHRYRANHFQIEHRYFQYSAIDNCWENLDFLTAEEAAQDFHNLFEALKTVFKGKWVMSGVSKGGITTLLQHTFFPDDMDVYVPYSAPFFDTDRDPNMQRYWQENGWSKEFRDMFKNVSKRGMYDCQTIYPIFEKMAGGVSSQAQRDSFFGYYLSAVGIFGYNEHTYSDTTLIRKQMRVNDSIMREKGVAYGDTVYAYMFYQGVFSLDSFPQWIDTLRKYRDEPVIASRKRIRLGSYIPFGVKESEWFGEDSIIGEAYSYQSKCELGYFDIRFDAFLDDDASREEWNRNWREKYGCLRDVTSPFFASRTFSRSLYDRAMAATKNATKPIVLIYGQDDSWTGAAVKDEFINGTNVRKFILPAQNHHVCFSYETDPAQCAAITGILDGVLGSPVGIDGIVSSAAKPASVSRKVLSGGKIFILRGNKKYTLSGVEVN